MVPGSPGVHTRYRRGASGAMDGASVQAHRKQSSRPVQAAQGDADGFQERVGPTNAGTGLHRPNTTFPPTRTQPSQTQFTQSGIVCGNAGAPRAETREAKFHWTVASALVAAKGGGGWHLVHAGRLLYGGQKRSRARSCSGKRRGSTAGPQGRHAHHARLRRISERVVGACSGQSFLRVCAASEVD